MGRFLWLFLLFLARPLSGKLYLAPTDKLTQSDDYDVVPYRPGPPFAFWQVHGSVNSTGRTYTAHVAQLSEGLPATFSYRLPAEGQCCSHLMRCASFL